MSECIFQKIGEQLSQKLAIAGDRNSRGNLGLQEPAPVLDIWTIGFCDRLHHVRQAWLPKAEDKSLFESFTVIGRALYDTRSGHELGDTEYAKSVVGPDRLFVVTVRNLDSQGGILCRQSAPTAISGVKLAAGMKDVSMSWWMSQPEQAFLPRPLQPARALFCVVAMWLLKAQRSSADFR
jgi:hypothetical protein